MYTNIHMYTHIYYTAIRPI